MALLREYEDDEYSPFGARPALDTPTPPPGMDPIPFPQPDGGQLSKWEPASGRTGQGATAPGLSGRPKFNFSSAPRFKPPRFQRPSFDDAMQEPGFQFRLRGGADALERSAAARGTLRTGGTLKDLTEYGQNFASAEYSNVYNRALQAFDREYRGQHDAYAPELAEWMFMSESERLAALAQFQREWQQYEFTNRGSGGGGGGVYDPPPVWEE